jgi:hypothetical protein
VKANLGSAAPHSPTAPARRSPRKMGLSRLIRREQETLLERRIRATHPFGGGLDRSDETCIVLSGA